MTWLPFPAPPARKEPPRGIWSAGCAPTAMTRAFVDGAGNAVGIRGKGSRQIALLGPYRHIRGISASARRRADPVWARRGRRQRTAMRIRCRGAASATARRLASSRHRRGRRRSGHQSRRAFLRLCSTNPTSASSASHRHGIASHWDTRGGCWSNGIFAAGCRTARDKSRARLNAPWHIGNW